MNISRHDCNSCILHVSCMYFVYICAYMCIFFLYMCIHAHTCLYGTTKGFACKKYEHK